MKYEIITGTTRAILVDVAEIGAALGSSDSELAASIVEVHQPRETVKGALVELLDGGALFDYEAEHYTEAFMLLCLALGEPLPGSDVAVFTDVQDPFDIPTELMSCRIGVLSPKDVAEVLSEYDRAPNSEFSQLQQWCKHGEANTKGIALFSRFDGQQTGLDLDSSFDRLEAVSYN